LWIDHKSKSELIERIHEQKEIRPNYVDALARRTNDLRNALKQDKASFETLFSEQKSKRSEIDEVTSNLEKARRSVTASNALSPKLDLLGPAYFCNY